MLVSRIQISGPGENNFIKWKGTFRSDRPDKFRSVTVKGLHSHARRLVGVNVFFSLGWEGDPPTRHRFSPYKGNQNFRIQNFDREGIRENFKILKKNNFEALVISIEKNTQVALWMTEQFL